MFKRILPIMLGLFLAVAATSSVSAQQVKMAHINSMELLSLMPEVKTADSKLEVFAKQLEDQNKSMVNEYQVKLDDYQKKEAMMMDAVKEVKQKEIVDLEKRIMTFQQTAQDKLAKKKEELYTPLLEKADKAIKDVAKENGFRYVFDSSAGALLYAEDSDNLLPLVRKKLGL